jgi:hypothetical protein
LQIKEAWKCNKLKICTQIVGNTINTPFVNIDTAEKDLAKRRVSRAHSRGPRMNHGTPSKKEPLRQVNKQKNKKVDAPDINKALVWA